VIAVAAASGAMAVTFPAYADSEAGSAGMISDNTIQLPVHVPVNVCGNTANVVGFLNPTAGNSCANEDKAGERADASGGAAAGGSEKDSPGVVSGNRAQLPVHLPVNVSGNTANVVGVDNPAVGNESTNTSGNRPDRPDRPDRPTRPAPKPSAPPEDRAHPKPSPHSPRGTRAFLAHTGTDQTLSALAGGTALVLGGTVLYRRFRPRTDS
jgi:LPXTG-motif cell wall-anchored protein